MHSDMRHITVGFLYVFEVKALIFLGFVHWYHKHRGFMVLSASCRIIWTWLDVFFASYFL